jgi:hypothetical protein
MSIRHLMNRYVRRDLPGVICRLENGGLMAAMLSEEGRFPAVQVIGEAEYKRFVTACLNPPAPTAKLRELLMPRSEAK